MQGATGCQLLLAEANFKAKDSDEGEKDVRWRGKRGRIFIDPDIFQIFIRRGCGLSPMVMAGRPGSRVRSPVQSTHTHNGSLTVVGASQKSSVKPAVWSSAWVTLKPEAYSLPSRLSPDPICPTRPAGLMTHEKAFSTASLVALCSRRLGSLERWRFPVCSNPSDSARTTPGQAVRKCPRFRPVGWERRLMLSLELLCYSLCVVHPSFLSYSWL